MLSSFVFSLSSIRLTGMFVQLAITLAISSSVTSSRSIRSPEPLISATRCSTSTSFPSAAFSFCSAS